LCGLCLRPCRKFRSGICDLGDAGADRARRRCAHAAAQAERVMAAGPEFGVFLPVADAKRARARSPTKNVRHMTARAEFGFFLPVATRSARERVRQQRTFAS